MRKNKKGVELMVSYVLLIVIAVALSVIVYSYLKLQIPKEGIECPLDTSLIAEIASCDLAGRILTVQLANKGLFNVSGVFLRFGVAGTIVKQQLLENKNNELFTSPLSPGQSTVPRTYSLNESLIPNVSDYELEIQPAVFKNRRIVPCSNVVVTQPVLCVDMTSP